MEWSKSLLRYFKIQTLLKINCCMAAISAFGVMQHSQIFSLFFRNRIQCIALYQLHNSQALLNLRRGYFSQFHPKISELQWAKHPLKADFLSWQNHSQASCEYSLTIFLCCQHHCEYSLLGSKFSTNLLFAASKCHVTIQQRGSSRCSKWPNRMGSFQ